ncbi:cellulose biosynthesis protein BcsO [Franconibacter pulveris 1160]|uniref:cellulose biosynthesis protein BcsO n=1 Tax=Franconibacter pulveris TaxID=435910 RepID=UPI0004650E5D|nr:cellulose biosynthesis protein BcsO [Franconibacter pulveris]
MTHYDDLQRFKDKTQTQSVAFKDMSAQRHAHEQGSWAILNQLAPEEENAALSGAGHVSRSVEVVSPGAFNAAQPAASFSQASPAAATAPALLRDVAQQLPATAPTVSAQPEPEPVAGIASEPAFAPDANALSTPAPVAVEKLAALAVAQAAPKNADPVNYAQLFAPKAPEAPRSEDKNQPLQGLFERIASCR